MPPRAERLIADSNWRGALQRKPTDCELLRITGTKKQWGGRFRLVLDAIKGSPSANPTHTETISLYLRLSESCRELFLLFGGVDGLTLGGEPESSGKI